MMLYVSFSWAKRVLCEVSGWSALVALSLVNDINIDIFGCYISSTYIYTIFCLLWSIYRFFTILLVTLFFI